MAVASLVLCRRASGDLAKDAMELRVAAEACVERGVEQRGLLSGVVSKLETFEESLHALTVTELDDGKPCLLFEEATKT